MHLDVWADSDPAVLQPSLHGSRVGLSGFEFHYQERRRKRVQSQVGDLFYLSGSARMGMVALWAAVITEPYKREVVGISLEAVLITEEFEEGSNFGSRDGDGRVAEFTYQVLVIVIQSDVPSSGLAVAERNVVNKADPG